MSANITDLLDRVSDSNTGRPIIGELAAPGKAIGASSINLAAATNWTTESAIHFSIYETVTVGTVTVKDTTTQTDWKGTLAGVSVGNLTITGGTDRAYTAGAIVEITPTARYAKDMYDWATAAHNQNGTHKAFTESNIVTTASLQDDAVTTAKIADGTITKSNVDFTSTGGIWWEEIGRATLNATNDTITVADLPPRRYLKLLGTFLNSGSINANIRFNNDASTNYASRYSISGAADSESLSVTALVFHGGTGVSAHFAEAEIINIATAQKLVLFRATATSGGSNLSGSRIEGTGKWINTTNQITRIEVVNTSTGDFAVGSQLVVLGHD